MIRMKKKIGRLMARLLSSGGFWSVWSSIAVLMAALTLFYLDLPNGSRIAETLYAEGSFLLPLFRSMFGPKLFKELMSDTVAAASEPFRLYPVSYAFLIWATVVSFIHIAEYFAYKGIRDRFYAGKTLTPRTERVFRLTYVAICAAIALVLLIVSILSAYFTVPDKIPAFGVSFGNLVVSMLFCVSFMLVPPLAFAAAVFVLFYLVYAVFVFFHTVLSVFRTPHGDAGNGADVPYGRKNAAQSPGELFPGLSRIDELNQKPVAATLSTATTLEEFCLDLQAYLAQKHELYYGLPMIRAFVSGMSASQVIIIQGLSGAGKSVLPRMFAEFVGCDAPFTPVQSTWRDRGDLIGYYNDFTRRYRETRFLKDLYAASYSDKPVLMILDEMNLSRIEYYFADFLSVMEFPPSERKIQVCEPYPGQKMPRLLQDGFLPIPDNVWFIGTANTDESTYTVTDKVYDRAIAVDFSERSIPILTNRHPEKINLSAAYLRDLFREALSVPAFAMNTDDTDKFRRICDFTTDTFDIHFGNRFMKQIMKFVPVYVAAGGTKEEALDLMFSERIRRKLDGAYEDYVKEGLIGLLKQLRMTYGTGVFHETENVIMRLNKKLV